MEKRRKSFFKWIVKLFRLYPLGVFAYFILYKQTWRIVTDDTNIIYFVTPALAWAILLVLRVKIRICLWVVDKAYKLVLVYGFARSLIFFLFACVFSYVFVAIALDLSVLFAWNSLKEELVRRFEDNIVQIHENRTSFDNSHVTYGDHMKTYPYVLATKQTYGGFGYRYEDAQFRCIYDIFMKPSVDPLTTYGFLQAVWRRNGQLFSWSARYSLETTWVELPENNFPQIRRYGLSVYRITATFSIRLLKDFDFGVYTCNTIDMATHSLWEWKALFYEERPVVCCQPENTSKSPIAHTNETSKSRVFEPAIMTVGHYHLMEMKRKPKPVTAPPGAILWYLSKYRHLDNHDNVKVEYFINDKPADQVCSKQWFHCSKLVLLYWIMREECSLYNLHCIPPLKLNYPAQDDPENAEYPLFLNCLCDAAYGVHRVEIFRQYYNKLKKRYELTEILHPQELIVQPREQDILNLHINFSDRDNILPLIESIPTYSEIEILGKLAKALDRNFQLRENLFWLVSAILSLLFMHMQIGFVRFVAVHGKRWILKGTLVQTKYNKTHKQEAVAFDMKKKFSQAKYDLYLSFSDAQDAHVTERLLPLLEDTLGLKVCYRERDIPPNLNEISAVTKAICNSKRFLILLSPEYLEDRFRKNIEGAAILEVASNDRVPVSNKVIVVKLADCKVPKRFKTLCSVHDWTSCLTREEDEYRLARWLIPVMQRSVVAEVTDIIIGGSPLWILLLVVFAVHQYMP